MNILDDLFERNILNGSQKKRFLQAFECYKFGKFLQFEKIAKFENYNIVKYKEYRCKDYGSLMDFVLFEAIYGLEIEDELYYSTHFQSILNDVCYHGVLVYDILSLPKELENAEFRNWVIIEFLDKGIHNTVATLNVFMKLSNVNFKTSLGCSTQCSRMNL